MSDDVHVHPTEQARRDREQQAQELTAALDAWLAAVEKWGEMFTIHEIDKRMVRSTRHLLAEKDSEINRLRDENKTMGEYVALGVRQTREARAAALGEAIDTCYRILHGLIDCTRAERTVILGCIGALRTLQIQYEHTTPTGSRT